jgi:hypothetical protein
MGSHSSVDMVYNIDFYQRKKKISRNKGVLLDRPRGRAGIKHTLASCSHVHYHECCSIEEGVCNGCSKQGAAIQLKIPSEASTAKLLNVC